MYSQFCLLSTIHMRSDSDTISAPSLLHIQFAAFLVNVQWNMEVPNLKHLWCKRIGSDLELIWLFRWVIRKLINPGVDL